MVKLLAADSWLDESDTVATFSPPTDTLWISLSTTVKLLCLTSCL